MTDSGTTVLDLLDDPPVAQPQAQVRGRLNIRGAFDRRGLFALAIYGVLGLIPNLPAWPGDPNHLRSGDLSFMTWGLEWTPTAILHGRSLVWTNYLNYPRGLNLLDNTTVPLLGILTAPLTLAVSPVSSMNLLLWLAYPLSAFSAYFVLRQVNVSSRAAFLGGLFYGFSPYMAGQGLDHLVVAFVPLPPLILFSVFVLFGRAPERPLRVGIVLGLLVVAQFLISSEVMATTLLVGAAGLAVLALARPRSVATAIVHARGGILAGAVIIAGLLAWPVFMGLTGPQHVTQSLGGKLSGDLLGPLIPTSSMRFHSSWLIPTGNNLVGGDYPENGSYLGLPLVLLLALICVRFWRDRWVRYATAMVGLTFVLSLGARLIINGHLTSIPLPFAILDHFSPLRDVADTGIALYSGFFVAVLLALGFDHAMAIAARRSSSESSGTKSDDVTRRTKSLARLGLAVLILGSVVLLIPNWPYPNSRTGVPAYFTSSLVRAIPQGSAVLVLPLPSLIEVHPEVWQAIDHMDYRIVGGYAIFSGPRGVPDPYPVILPPPIVEQFLSAAELGETSPLAAGIASQLSKDLRTFVIEHQIGTVTFSPYGGIPDRVTPLVDEALGPPSLRYKGTEVWYHATERAATASAR